MIFLEILQNDRLVEKHLMEAVSGRVLHGSFDEGEISAVALAAKLLAESHLHEPGVIKIRLMMTAGLLSAMPQGSMLQVRHARAGMHATG